MPSNTTIHVLTGRPVRLVKVNGEEVKSWRRDGETGMVSVSVQSGYGTITFDE